MWNFDLILVFIVIFFILVSLYLEILGPAFTFVVGIVVLGLFGVLTPSEIISGFANEQVAVIIMLLLIGDIIRRTAVIEVIFDKIFRSAKSYKGFLSRMTLLISGFSAFLNNTPLVALMMPYVHNWCRRNQISPSKFLIPLSYAAILGGCATLIGTSTNLIVNGLVVDQTIVPGLEPLKIFDFAVAGLPMILLGYAYLMVFGEKILPANPDFTSPYTGEKRQYLIEARVRDKSHLIHKTIEETQLLKQEGIDLLEISRRGHTISEIDPQLTLDKGDILLFAGNTEVIADMIKRNSGLSLPELGMLSRKRRTEVVEVVVSQNSTLINKTVRETNFRSKYDAAIISVHRNGERISGKLSQVQLKAGDVLLLFTGENFFERTSNTRDFYFITKVRDIIQLERYKVVVLLGGTLAAIILSAFGLIRLFMGLIVVILASLALKITNPKELPKNIDYNLAIIIVLSLALGTAMIKSGAADMIANSIISALIPLGKFGILLGIYLITTVLAAYITSKAAAAIIFPIALTTAVNLGLNPVPFVLMVAYASAANFMTPIGFQTNLMVYGPGGYSFKDFFRVGAPLTLLYMLVTVTILSLIYL